VATPFHDVRVAGCIVISYSNNMRRDTAESLKEGLSLPSEGRAALADSLLESLDTEVDADAEEAWQREAHRRAAELDSKTGSPIPWFEVRSRLMSRLKNGRQAG